MSDPKVKGAEARPPVVLRRFLHRLQRVKRRKPLLKGRTPNSVTARALSESARSPVTLASSVQAWGRILRLDFASDAPEDGGWERFQRLSGGSLLGYGGICLAGPNGSR
jgi:hypothetical protein